MIFAVKFYFYCVGDGTGGCFPYGHTSEPPDHAGELDACRSGEGVRAVCGGAVPGGVAGEDESADGLLF